jgi:hypothetical protein
MRKWRLCKDIQRVAKLAGIDYEDRPFRPKDLGLYANSYGSFSDWCSRKQTTSGRHNRHVCLRVVKRNSGGRPYTYVLLPEDEWYVEW